MTANLYDQTLVVFGASPAVAPLSCRVPEGPDLSREYRRAATPVTLGVDLAQVLFTPTLAMKVNDRHTVGASLIIGFQRFSARGLGNFQCLTSYVQGNDPTGCPL